MALSTQTMPSAPVGPARRLITITLDVALGVVVPVAVMSIGATLQFLNLLPMNIWVSDALVVFACLLWLTVLVALARRGRTPASVLTRQRWLDAAGGRASWRPLGSLSFWIAALPSLYTLIMFGEYLYTGGFAPFMGWKNPISDSMVYIGAACLMVVAIALPPYLRFRRQSTCLGRAAA